MEAKMEAKVNVKAQPVHDVIDDLRRWLELPPQLRQDASGAMRVLDEIAGSHGRLLAACEAALAYDAAIQRHAEKGQSWVEGDDLDALYAAWIDAARAAVAQATGN